VVGARDKAGSRGGEGGAPNGAATAELMWRLVMTELRHATEPTIRKFGDAQMNRALDVYLASAPEIDLAGYIRDLAQRRKASSRLAAVSRALSASRRSCLYGAAASGRI